MPWYKAIGSLQKPLPIVTIGFGNDKNCPLGAKLFGGGNRMFIDTKESLALVKQYFKNFNHG
jgi:hypothetical protein